MSDSKTRVFSVVVTQLLGVEGAPIVALSSRLARELGELMPVEEACFTVLSEIASGDPCAPGATAWASPRTGEIVALRDGLLTVAMRPAQLVEYRACDGNLYFAKAAKCDLPRMRASRLASAN